MTDPVSRRALQAALNKAGYTMQFLDTQYGQNVGNAMNAAVVNLMASKGTQSASSAPPAKRRRRADLRQ